MMEMRMTTDLTTALPAAIVFNFDELKAELTERLHHYNSLVVTEEAIQDAKNDRANLRKLKDAIETSRKEVKKQCEQPYKAFEAQVKELTALIDAPVAAIDSQIKAFEDRQREEKHNEIAAAYDELVPEALRDIIPLNRILDPRWLNKSTSMKSIREAIETVSKRTKVDVTFLESAVDPKYITAVRAEYIKTLDIDKAMDHRDQLVAAEQKFRQLEAQRAASQPTATEKPPVTVQEPVAQPAPIPRQDTRLHDLTLAFRITQSQATALKQFLEANHIQYKKIV